jgi:hypothetical protein
MKLWQVAASVLILGILLTYISYSNFNAVASDQNFWQLMMIIGLLLILVAIGMMIIAFIRSHSPQIPHSSDIKGKVRVGQDISKISAESDQKEASAIFCPYCGKANKNDAVFCQYCGKSMA